MPGIDPRYLTTPLGAALGLALTRKVLSKEHHNIPNLAIGTGLGAGAGYAIGDVLPKPHPDTGPATQREVDDVYSTYGSDVVTGGYDPKGGAKHQAMKDVRESRVQYLAMLARARRQTRAGKEDLAQQSRDTAETIRDKKLRGGLDGFLRSMFQSGAAGVKSAVKGVGDATGAVLRS